MQLGLFVCGCGSSFLHKVDDDDDPLPVPCKKSQTFHKKSSFKKKRNKNPYSSCGQEKFFKVLADLEEERQQIYRRMGSKEKLLVRFCHKDGKEWVPIVVKLNIHKEKSKKKLINHVESEKGTKTLHVDVVDVENKVIEARSKVNDETKRTTNKSLLLRARAEYHWYMLLVLILFCLVMFGRSFAIVCASVLWYLLTSVKGEDTTVTVRRSMKKKSFGRKLSEKPMAVKEIHNLGSMKRISPR